VTAPDAAEVPAPSPETARRPSAIGAIFGPGISIGELFSYLGAGFLLAATDAFIVRTAGAQPDPETTFAVGAALQAAVLAAILIERAFRRDDSAFVYPAALSA
jgi:hypothetical protein